MNTPRPDREISLMPESLVTQVTVGGHVKKPGAVFLKINMTLLEVIEAAGGATPFGSVRRVEVLRDGQRFQYDLRNLRHQRISIQEGDLINVPEKVWIGR